MFILKKKGRVSPKYMGSLQEREIAIEIMI